LLLAANFVVIVMGGRGAGGCFCMCIKYSDDTRNIMRNITLCFLAVEIWDL